MMERYYDAHLYLTNWGTHRIMLRMPRDLLDIALVRTGDRSPMLFVPSTNQAAVELAAAAGFVPRRTLRHMIRGLGETPSPVVFGRANLGHG